MQDINPAGPSTPFDIVSVKGVGFFSAYDRSAQPELPEDHEMR